jgi:small nuclear ribonucleoprotein (snRNP)-like protein
MTKKILCLLLSCALLDVTSFAQTNDPVEKFKAQIVNWGLEKPVTVKLKTGEQVKGRVVEIKDDFFAVLLKTQATPRPVKFNEIDKLTGHIDWGATRTRNYIGLISAIGLAAFVAINLTRSRDREPKVIFSSR